MSKKKKRPKVLQEPSAEKRPRIGGPPPAATKTPRAKAPPIPYDERPSWRLALLDQSGPWSWGNMRRPELERAVERLQALETMTWGEILERSRKENHAIPIESLCKEAQGRLVELRLDDVDDVISLRVTGRQRIIGLRFGPALRLLWWDPNHEVCPSTKKNT